MSILGAFLAFGWLGISAIRSAKTNTQFAVPGTDGRIIYKNGKYWDTVTRQYVWESYIRDYKANMRFGGWRSCKTGLFIWIPEKEKFYAEEKEMEEKVQREKDEKEPAWRQEAIDNGYIMMRCVLPHIIGSRHIYYGYKYLNEDEKDEKDREYYGHPYQYQSPCMLSNNPRYIKIRPNNARMWSPVNRYGAFDPVWDRKGEDIYREEKE